MTTRHAGYLVVLRDDIREDSDDAVRTALRMVSGVVSVQPIPADATLAIAEDRADVQWREKIGATLRELMKR